MCLPIPILRPTLPPTPVETPPLPKTRLVQIRPHLENAVAFSTISYGTDGSHDIEFMVGFTEGIKIAVHSKLLWAASPYLARRMTARLWRREGYIRRRNRRARLIKYRAWLYADKRGDIHICPVKSFGQAISEQIISQYCKFATTAFASAFTQILNAIYHRPLIVSKVHHAVELSIELECARSLATTFIATLLQQRGWLTRSIKDDPVRYLRTARLLESPQLFREAYSHVVGRWMNPEDPIRKETLPPHTLACVWRGHDELKQQQTKIENQVAEVELRDGATSQQEQDRVTKRVRFGDLEATVNKIIQRHLKNASALWDKPEDCAARFLEMARTPIILPFDYPRSDRLADSSETLRQPRTNDDDREALERMVSEGHLPIRRLLEPLLRNRTTYRNMAADLATWFEVPSKILHEEPRLLDVSPIPRGSLAHEAPNRFLDEDGKATTISYLLCAEIGDDDLPW